MAHVHLRLVRIVKLAPQVVAIHWLNFVVPQNVVFFNCFPFVVIMSVVLSLRSRPLGGSPIVQLVIPNHDLSLVLVLGCSLS